MQILIKNIRQLVQVQGVTSNQWVAGKDMAVLPSIENAYLLIENGLIADFGEMENCPESAREIMDVSGKMVFPCWCDSHTHLVFAATREQEFRDRIQGLTYQEIAERGGGILNSARRLQKCSEEELLESTLERLEEIRGFGTGAVEIKSGYGLTFESELKILRVVQKLKKIADLSIKATFLGAHAIPLEYKNNRKGYVRFGGRKNAACCCRRGFGRLYRCLLRKGGIHSCRNRTHPPSRRKVWLESQSSHQSV